ncbi:MAG: hypothetical protein KBS54_02310, partial [Synergistaceae bacterium]|nr:hypothetical protein [Candidatus Equadaptatus faecalis]
NPVSLPRRGLFPTGFARNVTGSCAALRARRKTGIFCLMLNAYCLMLIAYCLPLLAFCLPLAILHFSFFIALFTISLHYINRLSGLKNGNLLVFCFAAESSFHTVLQLQGFPFSVAGSLFI